jgi:hypothetical protein
MHGNANCCGRHWAKPESIRVPGKSDVKLFRSHKGGFLVVVAVAAMVCVAYHQTKA